MNQGRIIVITGAPGTGKTTTASAVAKESDLDLFVEQPPVNYSLTLKPPVYRNNGSHATVINLLSKDF